VTLAQHLEGKLSSEIEIVLISSENRSPTHVEISTSGD